MSRRARKLFHHFKNGYGLSPNVDKTRLWPHAAISLKIFWRKKVECTDTSIFAPYLGWTTKLLSEKYTGSYSKFRPWRYASLKGIGCSFPVLRTSWPLKIFTRYINFDRV